MSGQPFFAYITGSMTTWRGWYCRSLPATACMQAVAGKLRQYQPRHVVIDPVMYAKNGCPLMKPDAVGAAVSVTVLAAVGRTGALGRLEGSLR